MEMTLPLIANLIPNDLIEYVKGISFGIDWSDIDLSLSACVDDGFSFTCDLVLFSNGDTGIYKFTICDEDGEVDSSGYIPIEAIKIVSKFISFWEDECRLRRMTDEEELKC